MNPLPLLFTIIGIACAYFITGKLGLWLAIPPGFATAVWPASGIAIACALRFGNCAYIGIFLGSLTINTTISLAASHAPLSLSTLLIPSLIALGSTLQSLLACLFTRAWLKTTYPLDGVPNILRFLFVIAPLSCIMAASVGISTLWYFSIVPSAQFSISWFTWWVGDTLGLFCFAPITLLLLNKKAWSRQSLYLSALISILFVLVVSFFIYTREVQNQQKHTQQLQEMQPIMNNIEQYVAQSTYVISAFNAFYLSSNTVDRDEFNQFSRVLLQQNDFGIQALEWIPKADGSPRI